MGIGGPCVRCKSAVFWQTGQYYAVFSTRTEKEGKSGFAWSDYYNRKRKGAQFGLIFPQVLHADITSNMPGALVYLDGIYKGSTYSGSPFNVISVSPGSHTLLLHVPGYTDFTKTIEVNAGQISNINAEFTASATPTQNPVSPSSATGSIIITSTPAGGQVTVDDKFRGVAPVTIYNLGTGSHIINMKLPGYSDWSTSVDVSANQMVQVSAKLTPGSGAVPVTPSIGLSPFAIIGGLAIGAIVLSSRKRK